MFSIFDDVDASRWLGADLLPAIQECERSKTQIRLAYAQERKWCAILRDEQSLHTSARFSDSFVVEGSKGLANILPEGYVIGEVVSWLVANRLIRKGGSRLSRSFGNHLFQLLVSRRVSRSRKYRQ